MKVIADITSNLFQLSIGVTDSENWGKKEEKIGYRSQNRDDTPVSMYQLMTDE